MIGGDIMMKKTKREKNEEENVSYKYIILKKIIFLNVN